MNDFTICIQLGGMRIIVTKKIISIPFFYLFQHKINEMEDENTSHVLNNLTLKKQLENQALSKLLSYQNLQKVLQEKKWRFSIKISVNKKTTFDSEENRLVKSEILPPNEDETTAINEQLINEHDIKQEELEENLYFDEDIHSKNNNEFLDEEQKGLDLSLNSEPEHKEGKKSKKGKRFNCPKCERFFHYKSHLTRHVSLVHDKLRPFSCTKCDLKLFTKIHLEKHIQVIHDGVTPHQCSHCEAAFAYKDQLRTHIKRNHEGAEIPPKISKRKEPWKNEKGKKTERVSCLKCEKSFSSKIFLANHVLLIHEKVKPFLLFFFFKYFIFILENNLFQKNLTDVN